VLLPAPLWLTEQEQSPRSNGFSTNVVMLATTVNRAVVNKPTAGAVCLQCLQKLLESHLSYGQAVVVVQVKPVATAVPLPLEVWAVATPLEP
jgi:hypothetical protein